MDQDFHFYGTFCSAISGGFNKDDATLIAKAANFIDFFHEKDYLPNWHLVTETKKSSSYHVVGTLDNPRYTFQAGYWDTFQNPQDSVWCSYHFIPGNYDDPAGTPTIEEIHGREVASHLPGHLKRNVRAGEAVLAFFYPEKVKDLEHGRMLNRPLSALSRRLVQDAVLCATDEGRLEKIISLAVGGEAMLKADRADVIRRFKLILLGVRAHVIADTWAHQDHCGLDNVMNTYWDADYDYRSINPFKQGWGRQSVYYKDGTTKDWKNIVLSAMHSTVMRYIQPLTPINYEATPNRTSYLGHGWLGHFPDFSFIKFRYKPCWSNPLETVERNNPKEYEAAWIELTSLFHQARTGHKLQMNEQVNSDLNQARQAINTPVDLAGFVPGRVMSQIAWLKSFREHPDLQVNTDLEPDASAVMGGLVARDAVSHVHYLSDLYLFQIAADYHFHFTRHYLKANGIYNFTGSWSHQGSALPDDIVNLFA